VELYFHFPVRLHGVVLKNTDNFNLTSRGIIFVPRLVHQTASHNELLHPEMPFAVLPANTNCLWPAHLKLPGLGNVKLTMGVKPQNNVQSEHHKHEQSG
jgi:hypothetical protein